MAKLTTEQLTGLTNVMGDLNTLIADTYNLNIHEREISLAKTKLEEAELWLGHFILMTPGVQDDLRTHPRTSPSCLPPKMKATIRYTQWDGYRIGEESIVRVSEITHCTPQRAQTSAIHLTNGSWLYALESIDEIERRIDAAEGAEFETP